MHVTQNARQSKADQQIVLLVLSLVVAAGVWLVTRLLSR